MATNHKKMTSMQRVKIVQDETNKMTRSLREDAIQRAISQKSQSVGRDFKPSADRSKAVLFR